MAAPEAAARIKGLKKAIRQYLRIRRQGVSYQLFLLFTFNKLDSQTNQERRFLLRRLDTIIETALITKSIPPFLSN